MITHQPWCSRWEEQEDGVFNQHCNTHVICYCNNISNELNFSMLVQWYHHSPTREWLHWQVIKPHSKHRWFYLSRWTYWTAWRTWVTGWSLAGHSRGDRAFSTGACHDVARQHCRLSICSYFGWVWQILREAGLSRCSGTQVSLLCSSCTLTCEKVQVYMYE